MRLGQLNLYVTDLDASMRFYAGAFGFRLEDEGESFRTIRAGSLTLTLFVAAGGEASPPRGTHPGMTADLIVDDFDAAIGRIATHGGSVGDIEAWSGGRFALFADPDGIGWELVEQRASNQ